MPANRLNRFHFKLTSKNFRFIHRDIFYLFLAHVDDGRNTWFLWISNWVCLICFCVVKKSIFCRLIVNKSSAGSLVYVFFFSFFFEWIWWHSFIHYSVNCGAGDLLIHSFPSFSALLSRYCASSQSSTIIIIFIVVIIHLSLHNILSFNFFFFLFVRLSVHSYLVDCFGIASFCLFCFISLNRNEQKQHAVQEREKKLVTEIDRNRIIFPEKKKMNRRMCAKQLKQQKWNKRNEMKSKGKTSSFVCSFDETEK